MEEEKKEGNGKCWELAFVMAAGPEVTYIPPKPGEREAMELAARIRARRDDWILLGPSGGPNPERLQFPRGYNTAIRIREHREAPNPLAPPIAAVTKPAPMAPDGAEAH